MLVHGLAASGRTGSRTSRGSRRTGAWWRWTFPGSGSPPSRATRRSPSPVRPAGSTSCATARAREGRPRRQLDGRIHRRRGGDPVPGAGVAARARLRRGHLERRDDPANRSSPSAGSPPRSPPTASPATGAGRPTGHAAPVARPGGPPSAAPEARPGVRGLLQGRRQARLRRRPARLAQLRLPRPAARREGAHADRLGRARLDHPDPRRRRVRAPDRGQPEGGDEGHRPRADGRAAAGVQ